jgi:hypothetical protein
MATKTKAKAAAADWGSASDVLLTPAFTTEERLQRLVLLGQRIEGYIQFMCKIDRLNGSSHEAKEKAVSLFYDRLLMLEKSLNRIQEEVRLG